jgi:CPA1 family monovalent cation:H+ antiporter
MIQYVEIILALLGTVVALELVARKVSLPSPFLLLPAGILLGFVPGFPHVTLDPDLVLYVFLPPLVYSGAALGSWVEFRKNLRPIALMSVGCVLFTTVVVALVTHQCIPAFGWATAFVLGAIVSPPDEVAAISIARRLGIPKGISAVLEGEGLVNDAAALTVYRFAAAAVVTHAFSFTKATGAFTMVVLGEIAWGLLVGWAILRIRRSLRNTSLEISLSLLTPFVAYLPAQHWGGSGVLATVSAGLYVSYMSSHWVGATTRLQLTAVWQIIEFILDGILFLVAGLQFDGILEPLSHMKLSLLLAYGVGISLLVIVARMVWVFLVADIMRRFGISVRRGEPNPRWQRFFVVSWSGMRGAISLAAAFSIPLLTSTGAVFPERDLMIFLTFCVIISTLMMQGLSLPWLIRYFHIDREGRQERAEAGHQEVEARRQAAEASLALLALRRKEGAYPETLLTRIETQYLDRSAQFRAHLDGDHDGALQNEAHRFNVQTELLETERQVILKLRRSGVIDDDILRRIEKDLDLQEMRLRQGISEYELSEEDRTS